MEAGFWYPEGGGGHQEVDWYMYGTPGRVAVARRDLHRGVGPSGARSPASLPDCPTSKVLSPPPICASLPKHRSTNTVSATAFERCDWRIRTGQLAVPAFARRLRHPGIRPHQPDKGMRDSSPRQPLHWSGGRRRHVEPDASRGACPARRRLLRVKPSGMALVA